MVAAKKRATIKDVAALAGVSYQTVSRVINQQSGVTDTTRDRINQAIETLGYRPNLAARSLPRRRSSIIGLIIPYTADYLFRDPHLLAQISGVDAEANAYGYNVLLSTAGNGATELEAYERLVRNQVADGALVVETATAQIGGDLLSKQNYHFVELGYGGRDDAGYCVHADDCGGAYAATQHLLDLEHRRIGIINGPPTGAVLAMEMRLAGHRQALTRAGIRYDPGLMASGDYSRASGQEATARLLSLPDPPTAIFAFNDRMAMGAIWALKAAGLRVPDDVAVVGFDDVPAAADFSPSITTVRQPSREIGRVAAQMLFKLINGEAVVTRQVVLPAELVVRQSA